MILRRPITSCRALGLLGALVLGGFVLGQPVALRAADVAVADAAPAPTTWPAVSLQLQQVQDAYFQELAVQEVLSSRALMERLRPYGARVAILEKQSVALRDQLTQQWMGVVDRLASDLEAGRTDSLVATVEALRAWPQPQDQAFGGLFRPLGTRLKFLRMQAPEAVAATLDASGKALDLLATSLAGRSASAARARISKMLATLDAAAAWALITNGGLDATIDLPTSQQISARLDLNRATVVELAALPGVGPAMAERIVALRKKQGGLNGLTDLAHIDGLGPKTMERLAATTVAGDFTRPRRPWTVLSYAAMSNNLEDSGLEQMNAMEKVGSGPSMHIVRQMSRSRSESRDDRNWAGSRRFYVTKDGNPDRIVSPILANLGDIDSGRPQSLVDFCTWAIPLFPGDRTWLALENHGGGPLWGYGSDDDHGTHQTLSELGTAVKQAVEALRRQTGRPDARFDVISLHACMMGTLEVVYELRPYARVILVSESIGWGGWGWEGYLSELAKAPSITLDAFAVQFAEHLKLWVRGLKDWDWREVMNLTITAIDTDRLGPLVEAVDDLGKQLRSSLVASPGDYVKARAALAPFGSAHDLDGFASSLSRTTTDTALVAAAKRVTDVLGHPPVAVVPGLIHGLRVHSKKPGSVVWSTDGWTREPPVEMRPEGTRPYLKRPLLETPLKGPDRRGKYSVTFPDFDAGTLDVHQIDWRLVGPRGGLGPVRVLKNLHPDAAELVTTRFGPSSPLIVEAHTQGYAAARGLALVLPMPTDPVSYRRFLDDYRGCAWARETSWGPLAETMGSMMMPSTWTTTAPASGPPTE